MAARNDHHEDTDDSQLTANDTSPAHQTSIAFIVHSADTLTNNLPPNVDNKSLARQKRRRTSPEDQAILETEYQKNSKPDKAARMAIVKRVALGEKEVQIWFQNRRQASRRRSKPLELHELIQYQRMRASQLNTPQNGPYPQDQLPTFSATPTRDGHVEHDRTLTATPETDILTARRLPPLTASATRPQVHTPLAQDSSTPPSSYLADMRNDTAKGVLDDLDDSPTTASRTQDTSAPRPIRDTLRRASSNVRLSMSFDGNAKVITNNDSTPSPPRRQPSPYTALRPTATTEDADHTDSELAADDAAPKPSQALTRKPSIRSRDSRAWEYWADKDSRSSLTSKADQENSGSAADAIGLLRSSSTRNPLAPLSNKRTGLFAEPADPKRRRTPLLQRSQSMHNAQSPRPGKRAMKKAMSMVVPPLGGGESDKENWSPERDTITPGKTLLGRMGEASSPIDGDSGERRAKSNSVSEEEELDCVQGLLSLSQGNWR